MNILLIQGNLGKDPEIKQTSNGKAYARLAVAVNMSYKDKSGEWVNETQWFDVTAWGKLADKAGQMQKGQPVFIRGQMRSRKSEDKVFWGVRAQELAPLAKEPAQAQGVTTSTATKDDEDLPF